MSESRETEDEEEESIIIRENYSKSLEGVFSSHSLLRLFLPPYKRSVWYFKIMSLLLGEMGPLGSRLTKVLPCHEARGDIV